MEDNSPFVSSDKATSSDKSSSVQTDISRADITDMDFSFSDRDITAEYDKNNQATIKLNSSNAKIEGNGIQNKDGAVVITKAGTYTFEGSLNSIIRVEAGDSDKVQIVLDNVTINNSGGPAIYIKSADKVFITLADGSENKISDGTDYTLTDGDTNVDGAIFSKSDLTINGKGSLTVNGNCKHAIISKDDLVISDSTLEIRSVNVGLNGKDCVKINNGNIKIFSGSDAIRSDNSEDSSRGYVYIEGGILDLVSDGDGIAAETVLKINNAEISVISGGGSSQSYTSSNASSKGFKAGSDILISGGKFSINSLDDCIHSNNTLIISDGVFSLSSGDDGIHADTSLSVAGGEISILKSYEGLEASRILISGGNINIVASDDGINAAGGNDGSSMGTRPGQGRFSSSTGEIIILGGYTVVNASGDGIDSNGTINVSGGITLVSGPTSNGNGSFDYEDSASVTGGILIALGSSGMAQGFTSAENQGAILCSFQSQSGGTSFALCDSSGKAVVSFTPEKAYQSAVVTAPKIQASNTYTLVAGGKVTGADQNGFAQNAAISGGTALSQIEMTSTIYSSGDGMHRGSMNGGGMHRPGDF